MSHICYILPLNHKHLNIEDHISISDKHTEDCLCEHLIKSMSDKESRTSFVSIYNENIQDYL